MLSSNEQSPQSQEKWVLQLCHGYDMPFHDVARQYASLFDGTVYKVATVFLTGKANEKVARSIHSDDVIFLENRSKDIRGLKIRQIRQLHQLCKERHYEFCIAHRFKPIYIATHVKGLFVVGVQHAFGVYSRLARRIYVQSQKKNLALVGVSDAVRDDIRRSLPKFPAENIQTLYNRIDIKHQKLQLMEKTEARRVLKLPETGYIFGNVGRLHPDKDQSTILKAFAEVSRDHTDAYLVIIGKGRLEGTLKQEAVELGIEHQTIFTGVVTEAAKYFTAFDSFVLSSDHEPFGMVLLEAMAAGVPIITCDTGGAPEVVGNLAATFKLGDSVVLVRQMQEALTKSQAELDKLREAMDIRLQSCFSDKAVTATFWTLPFMRKYSGLTKAVSEQELSN